MFRPSIAALQLSLCFVLLSLHVCHPWASQLPAVPVRDKADQYWPLGRGSVCNFDHVEFRKTLRSALQKSKSREPSGSGDLGYIPVLGVAVYSDPGLLLLRLVWSIDFPVKHLVVVHGGHSAIVKQEVDHVQRNFRNATVVRCQGHLGCAEGTNLILAAHFNEPWFVVVAYDVMFKPGALHLLSRRFWKESSQGLDMAFINYVNMDPGGYNVFMTRKQFLLRVGFFDENFFPAYYEDVEFDIRLRNAGANVSVFMDVMATHGLATKTGYHSGLAEDGVMATSRQFFNAGINASQSYLQLKWGCPVGGPYGPASCLFLTPFNAPGTAVYFWTFDIEGRAKIARLGEHPPTI